MSREWPALSYEQWSETCDTLHAHTQVLGKLAVVLAPPEPQLQHAALRLTARGWETAPLPAPDGSGALVVALDLRTHEAVVEHSGGGVRRVALAPDRAVGTVTREVLDGGPRSRRAPSRSTRRRRRSRGACRSTRIASTRATTPLRSPPTSPPRPRRRSCSRSSARRIADAPRRSTRGGARSTSRSTCSPASRPTRPRMTSSCATRWMLRRSPSAGGPAIRATARRRSTPTRTPRRTGSRTRRCPPRPRTGMATLGEYILDWDDVRASPDPHAAALEFARSAFSHACAVCDWDPALAASAESKPPPIA